MLLNPGVSGSPEEVKQLRLQFPAGAQWLFVPPYSRQSGRAWPCDFNNLENSVLFSWFLPGLTFFFFFFLSFEFYKV